jgi:hypothetical protein
MKTMKFLAIISVSGLMAFFSCNNEREYNIDYDEIIRQKNLQNQYDSAKWEFYFLNEGRFGGKYTDENNKTVIYEDLFKCDLVLDSLIFRGDTTKYYFSYFANNHRLKLYKKEPKFIRATYYYICAILFIVNDPFTNVEYCSLEVTPEIRKFGIVVTDQTYLISENNYSEVQKDSLLKIQFLEEKEYLNKLGKDSLNSWLIEQAIKRGYFEK